jgi:hypothetical protein
MELLLKIPHCTNELSCEKPLSKHCDTRQLHSECIQRIKLTVELYPFLPSAGKLQLRSGSRHFTLKVKACVQFKQLLYAKPEPALHWQTRSLLSCIWREDGAWNWMSTMGGYVQRGGPREAEEVGKG